MNLIDLQKTFKTDDDALEYLAQLRWPDGVRCVTCGTDKVKLYTSPTKKQPNRKVYQCQEPTCKQQFTTTAGTIFHDTHLPLTKWFAALALIADAKKGISAKQLQRHLGTSYKAAWYLAHRIRKAMEETDKTPLTGIVEMDETYIGGKTIRRKNRGKSRYESKDAVFGLVERGGRLRFRYLGKGSATSKKIGPIVRENVSRDVQRVITDESSIYPFAFDGYCASKHETIAHKYEYVRGDVHTNTIESAFSLLKRGIMGSFHSISIKHLSRYLSEFEYRFNRREEPDRFEETLARMTRVKPMPFATLTAEEPVSPSQV
ncbi:MAG: IS1595 family transposase [Terriglobales bacterium]